MNASVRAAAVTCLLALAVGVGAFAGVGAAQDVSEPVDGRFLVELQADGDAEISLERAYDLTNDDERDVFETLAENETARRQAAAGVRADTQYVSDVASNETDREMSVGEVTVETSADGEVGTVAYRFEWEQVAAVSGDRLVLSEPFSLYSELDRRLVVRAPEGYELAETSPDPSEANATRASWAGFTPLSEFEVVAEPANGTTGENGDSVGDGAGFGAALAAVALLAAALLARRV